MEMSLFASQTTLRRTLHREQVRLISLLRMGACVLYTHVHTLLLNVSFVIFACDFFPHISAGTTRIQKTSFKKNTERIRKTNTEKEYWKTVLNTEKEYSKEYWKTALKRNLLFSLSVGSFGFLSKVPRNLPFALWKGSYTTRHVGRPLDHGLSPGGSTVPIFHPWLRI